MTGEVEVTETEYIEAFPDVPLDLTNGAFGASGTWKKPVESVGLAVVPKRIKDAEAYCAKHGVPTDFTSKRGVPILKDRAHRKKVLKLFKMHDNEGGIGD